MAHPNLKGFFGANEGSAIGVLNAVIEMNMEGKIVVIGYDSGKPQMDAIRPIGIGYEAVKAAYLAIKGEKLDKTIDTGFYWFDNDTIDADHIKPLLYD